MGQRAAEALRLQRKRQRELPISRVEDTETRLAALVTRVNTLEAAVFGVGVFASIAAAIGAGAALGVGIATGTIAAVASSSGAGAALGRGGATGTISAVASASGGGQAIGIKG